MLPKSQRLNLKKDFKWVTSGKKIEATYMRLFLKTGENLPAGGPKVGIAISSQVFKKATLRNRAKRLVSAAFESIVHHLPSTINIVTLPKAGILDVKFKDVLLDLEKALNGEKILNSSN